VASLKRKERKKYILFTLILSLVLSLLSLNSFGHENSPREPSSFHSESLLPSYREVMLEKINLLALHVIREGKRRTLFYEREDLRPGEPLEVEGYVSGVVVLCNDEVEVVIDGVPMSRIRENDDGTLTCKYFGPLEPEGWVFPSVKSIVHRRPTENSDFEIVKSNYLFGGYSFFPKVLGSGVSHKDRFLIQLEKGDASVRIPLRQQGHRTIFKTQPEFGEEVIFQYQGTSLADHLAEGEDLRQRMAAVSEGIRSVENRFDMDLVSRVNLVDYGEIHNAVTCRGEDEIWFYIETLRKESLEELKIMAEHETLHILVDRNGFVNDTEFLDHFADLKGFGMLSYERFMLITRGIVPEENEKRPEEDTALFAFVNEKNFFKGMKGGHSHQNPDEFCTSFLHTLMSVEQLRNNLDRPLVIRGHNEPRFLSREEKGKVLKDYITTLEILKRWISKDEGTLDRACRIRNFLEHAHYQARRECGQSAGSADDSYVQVSAAHRPCLDSESAEFVSLR